MHAFMVRHQTPVLLIIILAVVAAISDIGSLDTLQVTLTEMLIRVLVVVGLYVFIGNSGVISFGQIGFMCIGAYAAGWATAEPSFKQVMLQGLPDILAQNQWPFAVAMAVAIVLPTIVAFLFGLAILRLNGIAASIATFAFLIIVNSVYSNWDSVTAGVSSLVGIPTAVGPWVAFGFASAGIIVAYLFQISRYGLMLRATREDSVAAKSCGVHSVRMRLIAFVLSAALVGAGGGLYAQFLGILTVDTFYLSLSFITIAMLVVGGMGSLTGAVSGVIVVTVIVQLLRYSEHGVMFGSTQLKLPESSSELGLGVLLALILIFRPNGVSGGRELTLIGASKGAPPETVSAPSAPTLQSDSNAVASETLS
jgi:branched-chain amino acid transport system permease protein